MNFVVVLVLSVLLLPLYLFILWIDKNWNYWKRNGVPNAPALPLIGNLKDVILMRKLLIEVLGDIYNSISSPIVGIHIFHKPVLLIKDLELVKRILITDFNCFSDRYATGDPVSDPVGAANLFLLNNPTWRKLRAKLSSIFSIGKMRQMFELMIETGNNLNTVLIAKENEENRPFVINTKHICSQFTVDAFASCVFGMNVDSLHNPESEFYKSAKRIFEVCLIRLLEFGGFFLLPDVASFLKLKFFSQKTNQFIRSSINDVISEREKSGLVRNDLIDVFIKMKKEDEGKASQDGEIVMKGDAIVAQAAVFLAAGYEATSSLMQLALRLLAKNLDKQEKLRTEIKNFLIKHNGILTFDNINELEYLTMVVSETLRLYSPLPFLDRICTAETGYSLAPFSDFVIPKGMPVYIPVYSIHCDPEYYSDPDKFEPERFSPENKSNIIPCSYIPCGSGPRICIGERFGLLQSKVGLFNIFKTFTVTECESTPPEIRLEKMSLVLQEDNISLTFQKDCFIN